MWNDINTQNKNAIIVTCIAQMWTHLRTSSTSVCHFLLFSLFFGRCCRIDRIFASFWFFLISSISTNSQCIFHPKRNASVICVQLVVTAPLLICVFIPLLHDVSMPKARIRNEHGKIAYFIDSTKRKMHWLTNSKSVLAQSLQMLQNDTQIAGVKISNAEQRDDNNNNNKK